MPNLSLFKPCVDWCSKSVMSLNYEALWIIYTVMLILACSAWVLTSEKITLKHRKSVLLACWVCFALLAAFLLLTVNRGKAEIDKNIQSYVERLADDSPLRSADEVISLEDYGGWTNTSRLVSFPTEE